MCFCDFLCLLLVYGHAVLAFENGNNILGSITLSTSQSWLLDSSANSSQFIGDAAESKEVAIFHWNSPEYCIYYEDPEYFLCEHEGLFSNLNDPDCESYLTCTRTKNGDFIQKKYECPNDTYYNPYDQICDQGYECPCWNKIIRYWVTSDAESIDVETRGLSLGANLMGSSEQLLQGVAEFQCIRRGRFANPQDTTCQTYFLCNLLRSGRFVKTKYNCPANSYFNAEKQLCDTNYLCSEATPRPTTTVESTTTTAHTSTTSTITEISTSVSTTKKSPRVTTSTVISTTPTPTTKSDIVPCIFNENPNYFQCNQKGRYPNLNDPSCRTYFLCNRLRSGAFVKTKYSCPTNSFFDAQLQLCNSHYQCPCAGKTTLQPATTVTTLIPTTKEAEKCIHNEDPEYFQCTHKGRFPNLNDLTCESYYLCNLLRSGRFVKSKYKCPKKSYFDAGQQICNINYKCPCTDVTDQPSTKVISTSSTNTVTTTTSEETSLSTTESSITSSTPDEYRTSRTHPQTSTSTEITTDITSPIITTTTPDSETCVYNEDPEYFQCTKRGRFPNHNDLTCHTYFLCNLLRSGRFIKTKYNCPPNSFFDASQQLCNTKFKCPCINITTTETPVTITTVSTVSPPITPNDNKCTYIEDPNYFQCTQKGRFPNLNDVTCSSYFLCNLLRNGKFIKTRYQCPTNSFFNASEQLCSKNYKCPCSAVTVQPTTVPTTPGSKCIYQDDQKYFKCTQKGRFPNHNDLTCQSYYLCNLLRSGKFVQSKYQCPPNSYFDASQQLCNINYKCPCADATPTIATRGISTFTPTTHAPTTEDDHDMCRYEEDPEYFQCSKRGRFLNLNDLTCQTYYLCNLLRSGRFIKTPYKCPVDSFFNNRKQLCDKNYQCPCKKEDKREAPMLMALHVAVPPDSAEDQITTVSPETTATAGGLSAMLENLFIVLKFNIQGGDKESEGDTLQLQNVLVNDE